MKVIKYLQHKIKLLFVKEKEFYLFLKKSIGVTPYRMSVYRSALTHKSASQQQRKGSSSNNERLEFLGDAILDAVIGEYLYEKFPDQQEGFLSKVRSKIVSRDSLNQLACDLDIDKFVMSQTNHNKTKKNLYGNAFEALVGAIFLDHGYNYTYRWFTKRIMHNFINLRKLLLTESDFKSRLIEWGQKVKTKVVFDTFESTDLRSKRTVFISYLHFDNEFKVNGYGNSKKEAEQDAAKNIFPEVFPEKNI